MSRTQQAIVNAALSLADEIFVAMLERNMTRVLKRDLRPRRLPLREAAKYVGRGRTWLREKTISGEIPGTKDGRDWVYEVADLDDYCDRE